MKGMTLLILYFPVVERQSTFLFAQAVRRLVSRWLVLPTRVRPCTCWTTRSQLLTHVWAKCCSTSASDLLACSKVRVCARTVAAIALIG
jgi:hypothetical protein